MISIIRYLSGIHTLLALTTGMKYNSQSSCQHVNPNIQQNTCSLSRGSTSNGVLLHFDKAPAQDSPVSSERLNPQRPKEWRIQPIAQTRRSTMRDLHFWLSERKTPVGIVFEE
jgi:hypothetical protein